MSERKLRVGIIFGGRSSEHEVSLLSAKAIYDSLDKSKYEPVLIGIDKCGEWHIRDEREFLLDADDPKKIRLSGAEHNVTFVTKRQGDSLVALSQDKPSFSLDVVFPIIHGTNGEDGTLQGLLKLARVPFVGASVLGSAVGMDKDVMKRLLRDAGLPVGKFLTFYDFQKGQISFQSIVDQLHLPLFIKPANSGSSIGISKVHTEAEFHKALDLAFSYDRKILIEQYILGREVECSVIGNEHPIVSLPGEVIAKDAFNSWDAKYVDDCCTFVIPVSLEEKLLKEVQHMAIETYRVLCCEGMARVDFFLTDQGQFFINEINTIPGFTKLSVFPRLWQASGLSYTELLDKLIDFAVDRHKKEASLKTSYLI